MRQHGWLVLAIGFGTLILLIGLLGFGAMHRAQSLYDETLAAHHAYLQSDAVLREIPTDLHVGGVLIRDYLLDPSNLKAPSYREELRDQQSAAQARLDLLSRQFGAAEPAKLQRLRAEL